MSKLKKTNKDLESKVVPFARTGVIRRAYNQYKAGLIDGCQLMCVAKSCGFNGFSYSERGLELYKDGEIRLRM